MEYKERYKEVFSQIHPMKEFSPEELCMKKPYRSITKKVVGIAAVVALLASLCLTAYAVNLFGLRDLLLPQQHEVRLPITPEDKEADGLSSAPVQESYMADMISLAGYGDTPESKAVAEWQAFLDSYDQDGGLLGNIGNNPTGFEEKYGLYRVYTKEMADKLNEITDKYNLKLHKVMLDDLYTDEALCNQVGGDFLGENRTNSTYMYEDGTFHFDGEIDLEGYGHLDYQFQRCVRGSFTDIILNIVDINEYTEWSYATESGVPATLALAPHKALIIVDLPDSFVTINVLAGTDTSTDDIFSKGPFGAGDLERFADSFDFNALTPVRPADPDMPRPTLEEVLGKPTTEDFLRIAGVEEAEAQTFFAAFVGCVERDERQAVADMLYYPATVTWWNTTAAGTHQVYETVESPEEFLPFYDEIFTESLWWDCIMANRYDMEQADLIPDNGMVGAAGGAVWFMPTDDGMRVVTVQNPEDNSVRMTDLEISDGNDFPTVAETKYDSLWTAYFAVLNTLYYEHVFPDGMQYDPYVDGSGDQFALVDLHGDGTEELILLATNSYTAGQAGYVLSWEERTGTTQIELFEHPCFTFYDNGYLRAWASHNQGKAGDALWPYTLYQYDTETGTYQPVAMVDAWDRSLVEDSFPADADRSGTGVVYYVMEPDNYDLSKPMDAAEYAAWEASWLQGAAEVKPDYQPITAESILECRPPVE